MKYKDEIQQYTNIKEYQIKEQKYFIDDEGNKYEVDGKNVIIKTSEEEREIAHILGEKFGGTINLIPVVLFPNGIQTPDYIINNTKFDLKKVVGNGKNTLDTAIRKKKKQSNNFIFDITETKMEIREALKQIDRIYNAKNRTWVNSIILIKNNKVLNIFKRI